VGPPGAGKGVVCHGLAERISFCGHVPIGDIIRDRKLLTIAGSGNSFVAPQITAAIIESEILKDASTDGGGIFAVEGFPSCSADLDFWMGSDYHQRYPIMAVIHLKVNEKVGLNRCLKRARKDDTPVIVRRRFALFRQLTLPTIEALQSDLEIPFHTIITDNQHPLNVMQECVRFILLNWKSRFV
jgi:adenylate kinase family enzyme